MKNDAIPFWRKFFGSVAIACFVISLSVHSLTFWGIESTDYVSSVWLLHIGIFLLFIPFYVFEGDKNRFYDFSGDEVVWRKNLIGFFFIYALINFALHNYFSEGGIIRFINGEPFLYAHGKYVRQLTEIEYQWQRAYRLRGFSGHWMLFYFIAVLSYFIRRRSCVKSLDHS